MVQSSSPHEADTRPEMARHCQDFQEQNWSSGVHDLYSPAPAYENASEMRLRHNCINATAGFARSAYASHASTQRSSSSSTLCRHTRMAASRVVCGRYTAAHRRRLVRFGVNAVSEVSSGYSLRVLRARPGICYAMERLLPAAYQQAEKYCKVAGLVINRC